MKNLITRPEGKFTYPQENCTRKTSKGSTSISSLSITIFNKTAVEQQSVHLQPCGIKRASFPSEELNSRCPLILKKINYLIHSEAGLQTSCYKIISLQKPWINKPLFPGKDMLENILDLHGRWHGHPQISIPCLYKFPKRKIQLLESCKRVQYM